MHYYQHHIGDYLADTTHLTLIEHGAYLRLMMLYYQTECALDANALRMVCARSAEEMKAAETVLNEFFTRTEEGWIHKRCDAEINRFHGKSDAAKASAEARWSKRNANAMRTQCDGNANHKPITNNQEPLKEEKTGAPASSPSESPKSKREPRKKETLTEDDLVDLGVDRQHAKDWLKARKAKGLPLTKTALAGVDSEAKAAGMTLPQAVAKSAQEGWAGFKAAWLAGDRAKPSPHSTPSAADFSKIPTATDGAGRPLIAPALDMEGVQ